MSNRVLQLLLCMMFASSGSLSAKESGITAAISAAFSTKNNDKGLELVRQAFARLPNNQSVEAAALIRSILVSVPMDEAGPTVVAAMQGNPSLSAAILNASVSNATRDEQLAILSRLNFALSQHPDQNGALAQNVPGLLSNAERTTPVSTALTAPTYNPANSLSDTKTINSPSDIKQDEKDIRADSRQLQADQTRLGKDQNKLFLDVIDGKSPAVIAKDEAKIAADEAKIKSAEADLKADKKDLRQDELGH